MTKRKRFDAVARTSAIAVFEDELKTRSDGYVEHLAHGGKADCGEEFHLDALYMAIAALREQPRWISVEERLPEKYKFVLCYKDGKTRIGYYIGAEYVKGVAAFADCGHNHSFGVTHWLPLPDAPKEEA